LGALRAFWAQRRTYSTPGYSVSVQRVQQYAGLHRDQRCVIIDGSADLDDLDLSLLGRETTVGVDEGGLAAAEQGLALTYYVSVSPVVWEQSGPALAELPGPKFVSVAAYPHVKADKNLMFLGWRPYWGFSEDASKGVCQDHSSAYVAMQLAFYMGFGEVVFVGGARDERRECRAGEVGDDLARRGGPYIAPGESRRDSIEIAFRMAKVWLVRNGRRVFDATPNGTMHVFPKVDHVEHLSSPFVPVGQDAT